MQIVFAVFLIVGVVMLIVDAVRDRTVSVERVCLWLCILTLGIAVFKFL